MRSLHPSHNGLLQARKLPHSPITKPLYMPFPPPGRLLPLLLNLQTSGRATSQQRRFLRLEQIPLRSCNSTMDPSLTASVIEQFYPSL